MKMRQKMIYVLVSMLVLSTTLGAMASAGNLSQSKLESTESRDFTHTILGEYGTSTTCVPCKYAHAALKAIYIAGWYPFNYITLVRNKNDHAMVRSQELDLFSEPTVFFDGGYDEVQGGVDIEWCMGKYNQSIINCGNRNVKDIDLAVDIDWHSAVNPVPEDGETDVFREPTLKWNLTSFNVTVTVDNNEATDYEGHLHAYVTEYESSYWMDKFHYPYTFALLDYAFNEDVNISAGGTWQDTVEWDGAEKDNGMFDEDKIIFDDVFQDNVVVVASVFRASSDYSDETIGVFAGNNTYPKTFDIYFGNTTPPPLEVTGATSKSFSPGMLDWNTTYYWKIITWDNNDDYSESPIYNFTVRENHAPNTPDNPFPPHNSTEVPIRINMTWTGGDPDNDTTYTDIYFGDEFPPDLVLDNLTNTTWFEPILLEFNTRYYWKIVITDRWGAWSESENWTFLTQINHPPYVPSNPNPPDGANDVPVTANLSWKGGDPNLGELIRYEVYFEENNPDPQYIETIGPFNATQFEVEYDLEDDLEILKTYYWKIVPIDSQGNTNDSIVWSFSTGENFPPSKPIITGPKEGTKEVDYEFTFKSKDPEDANISYYITWGDGSGTGWLGPYLSDVAIALSYNWSDDGKYTIKAKAKDQYDQESEESLFSVNIPKNKIYIPFIQFIYNLLQRFPILEKLLSSIPIFNKILNQ